MQRSYPRPPCNPRNPRFRTQSKYEIPKLTLIGTKTLHPSQGYLVLRIIS